MLNAAAAALAALVVGVPLVYLILMLPCVRRRTPPGLPRKHPAVVLAVLGSGGHTAEMLNLLGALDPARYRVALVVGASDATSEPLARRSAAPVLSRHGVSFLRIPRAREVGQSWASSCWTTLASLGSAMRVVAAARPDVVLVNGPGTCIPILWAAFLLLRVARLQPHVRLIFVESVCRVRSLSLSGWLAYPVVDRLLVQWPQLASRLSRDARVEYLGRFL